MSVVSPRRSSPRRVSARRVAVAVVAGAATGLLALAPPAGAAFVGEAKDPAGDAAAPEAARDIVAAGFGYDRVSGRIKAAVALRESPSGESGALLVAYAGRRTASGCNQAPTVGVTASTTGVTAQWLRFDVPSTVAARGKADKSGGSSRVQEVEASDGRLAGLTPNCAQISLVHAEGQQVIYDSVTVDLRPLPSLGIALSGVPKTVRRGRSYTLKVKLTNPGDAPTGTTRLRLKRISGVTLKRSHRVASIAAGRSRTLRIPVRISSRAGGTEYLDATARAGTLKAEARRRMYVRYGSRKGSGGGSAGTPSTCVQYFPDLSGDSGGSLGLIPCVR